MNTEVRRINVSGIAVDVVRKDIKNLHLGVYPPHGRVRVAAPLVISDDAVRLAVIDKLGWIKRQRSKFAEQPRQSQREMVSGESHYFMGRRYRLHVIPQDGPSQVRVQGTRSLHLYVRPNITTEQREHVLQSWYRDELKARIPKLLSKWQHLLGVKVAAWGVRKMKTKWGSCNADARRVWFNLDLAKKPPQCLEYIVAHELVHLLVRRHDDRFLGLLDRHMPSWRTYRDRLKSQPLGHETWSHR